MESIKIIAIAFAVSSCIIICITNEKVWEAIFNTLDYRIGKSKIKIGNIIVIFVLFIIILYSLQILLKVKNRLDFVVEVSKRRAENTNNLEENISNTEIEGYNEIIQESINNINISE